MSIELDQISEAIGHLRAAQEGTNSNIARLEQRIEGAIGVLRDGFERNMQELRNRHHEQNNNVLKLLANVDQDIERVRDRIDQKLSPVIGRLAVLENANMSAEGARRAHRAWTSFASGLIAAIATGTIEGLIWLFGGHAR